MWLDACHRRFQALYAFAEQSERRPQGTRSAGQIRCDRGLPARTERPVHRRAHIGELRQIGCSPFRIRHPQPVFRFSLKHVAEEVGMTAQTGIILAGLHELLNGVSANSLQ